VGDAIATDSTTRTTDASWDWHWRRQRLPRLPRWFNPNVAFAKKVLWGAIDSSQTHLFEVGCAPGAWMGFLSRQLHVEVSGCDVSTLGVATARENLRLLGVRGRVYEADVFDLAEKIPDRFGLVYSFGVVEHFDDLASILRAHADLCEPGGTVLVTAPNLQGLSGAIFRRASPTVMDSHRLVTPTQLRRAARRAGLEPLAIGYGGPLSAFVWLDRIDARIRRLGTYGIALAIGLLSFSASSRLFSGSVYLIAKRPSGGS
jgi:2-polyprenyl-3-methyl-5-hydroxy-6-metoxy-1,4-benzoquinol methylase